MEPTLRVLAAETEANVDVDVEKKNLPTYPTSTLDSGFWEAPKMIVNGTGRTQS
jgi:hypothetical protein